MDRLFENAGDPVAQVYANRLELYHPQYFSDFEGLLRRYEQERPGVETTLTYWESPHERSSQAAA